MIRENYNTYYENIQLSVRNKFKEEITMKINFKTIIGAVAGLGLTAWAAKSMFGKDKAEEAEATEDNGDVEVDYVDDVEVEA